jgi:uncharacterized sulfatase
MMRQVQSVRLLSRALALVFATLSAAQPAEAAETNAKSDRPNILWITCEDLSPVLGCCGDVFALTPNLDRLAEQGVQYTRAFATASVCTPARSCLITGVHASSLGTQHLRGPAQLSDDIRCFSQLLRDAGYYCTNNVKEDYNFRKPPGTWDASSKTAHWRRRGKESGQPFFAVFNLMTTHQSRIRFDEHQFAQLTSRLSDHERHDPAKVPLPPYYPDTPVVRRDMARLYDMVTAMDRQVGDLLAQLEQDGLADETIVFFYADHGTGMPRHKRWLYDSGIHVPLIIRFPAKYRHLSPAGPGAAIDRMVSFVDFAPTVLSLAGIKIPAYMQGRAFLGDQEGKPRRYVFAIRDRVDEVYEMSRAVRDERYKYIRNFMPHRPCMQYSTFSERTPTRKELRRLDATGKLQGPAKLLMSPTKAPEELYDTQSDPHEIRNLAGSPEHQPVLERMSSVLHTWMIDTRDTGLLPEGEMHARAGGKSPYDMARRPDAFPVGRILKAAELVGRGPTEIPKLTQMLSDPDAGLRYWAATALAALGPQASPAAEPLSRLLRDTCPPVRFAAAEALCKLGHQDRSLPALAVSALVEGLQHPDKRVRLHAAIALAAVGPKAHPAIPAMTKALKQQGKGDYPLFTRWALEHALAELEK